MVSIIKISIKWEWVIMFSSVTQSFSFNTSQLMLHSEHSCTFDGKCTEQHQILRKANAFRVTEISDLRTPLFPEGSVTPRFYCTNLEILIWKKKNLIFRIGRLNTLRLNTLVLKNHFVCEWAVFSEPVTVQCTFLYNCHHLHVFIMCKYT